jgi:hypothetical protein
MTSNAGLGQLRCFRRLRKSSTRQVRRAVASGPYDGKSTTSVTVSRLVRQERAWPAGGGH